MVKVCKRKQLIYPSLTNRGKFLFKVEAFANN